MNRCEHSWTYSSVLLPQRGIAGSYSAWMCVEWELPNLIPECLSHVAFPLAMFLSLLCLLLCRGPQLQNLKWVEEDFFSPPFHVHTWVGSPGAHTQLCGLAAPGSLLSISRPLNSVTLLVFEWPLSAMDQTWTPDTNLKWPQSYDLIGFSSVGTRSWAGCCPMSENRFLFPPSFLVVHGGRVDLDAVLLPTFVFHLFKIILLHNFK